MGLRFEAWTLPTAATFEKRFDIDVAMAGSTGVRELSAYSDSTLVAPADWADIDSLVTDTEGAWIRVYDDTLLVDEFLAQRVAKTPHRPAMRSITGPQANGLAEWCGIYPYNYPANQSGEFDWHWGLDENLLQNPGAEDNPLGLANPGAEDGTRAPWLPGWVEGYNANLAVNGTAPRTGSFAWQCTALTLEGGMSHVVNVYPGRVYTLGAWIRTVSGTHDWSLTAGGPRFGTLIPITGTMAAPYPDEVADVQTISTTYTNFLISWRAGPDMNNIQINVRELNGVSFPVGVHVDDFTFTGFGIGIDPWEFSSGVIEFSSSQAVTPSEGSWHFAVTAQPNHGVFQRVRNVLPGETVTFQADLRGPVADTWSLELRDVNGALLPGAQTFVALDTGAWETVQATAVMPDFLPGDGTVQFWLANRALTDSVLYFDNTAMFSGLPQDTYTSIIRQLVEAAQARGTFLFLDLDFTDGLDTAGVAVTDISFSAFFGDGSNLSQPLRDGHSIGYDWRIVAKATPVGALTHDLQVWAPGSGPGDLTAAPGGPSVLVGGMTPAAEMVTRIPAFTTLLAHGAGALLLEETNATTEAAMGRIERVMDAEAIASLATLQELADAQFDFEEVNRNALSAVVLGTDQTVPLVDYTEGNIIWWQFPGTQTKIAKQVQRVGWTHGTPASYTLQGSTVFSAEGAMASAVLLLLTELKRRRSDAKRAERAATTGPLVVSGDLGAHLHMVGGSQSIAVAGEQVTWSGYAEQQLLPARNFAPVTFPTTEWTIQQTGYYDFHIQTVWDTWLEGGSVWLVRTRAGSPSTIWPVLPTSWTSTVGQSFEAVAPGIPCESGDVYEVFIDHGDGSAKTLDEASVAAVLVDRTFSPPPTVPQTGLLVFTEDTVFDFGDGFTFPNIYIVGAGGGGGGGSVGGGGGGGGVVELTNYFVAGVVSVVVGAGGTGGPFGSQGGDGESSDFDGNAAVGGGGGGGSSGGENGRSGGSGGGGGTDNFDPGIGGAGNPGGDGGDAFVAGTTWAAGGGGGMTGNGTPGNTGPVGGDGGPGFDLSAVTTSYGAAGFFAGGGGGCPVGTGGLGQHGGGNAADGSGTTAPQPGVANSGGGGGGGHEVGGVFPGAAGGDGIVICVP